MNARDWNERESRDWNDGDSGPGWADAADEKVIGTIDHYELLRELGTGGFGSVYLARDTVSRTFVAVKGLPQQVSDSAGELERIRANYALVSKLKHPNVAAVLALHRVDVISCGDPEVLRKLNVRSGDTLLVMDYAPGVTLDSWCRQFPDRKVPVDRAIEVTRQIADALDAAHKLKIVHRDVKPQNVMVETLSDGTLAVRVLDFAAEVRSSVNRVSGEERKDSSGTLQYMAPEQLEGHRASAAMDQYALAALFYELVTGDVPFSSVFECGDKMVIFNVVTTKSPEIPSELPRRVRKALARALAKKPEDRFASCGDFVAALQGKPVVDWRRVAGILAAVAVVGAGGWWWQSGRAVAPRPPQMTNAVSRVSEVPPAERHLRPKPGDTQTITLPGGVPMTFCWCPATTSPDWKGISGGEDFFWMGSPVSERGRYSDEKRHHVKLTKGFWIAQTPVTQRQYEAVVGKNPTKYDKGPDIPVSDVTWTDCQDFCRQLAAKLDDGSRFALPTEAQWEYACRAGTTTALNNGKDLTTEDGECPNLGEVAWYGKNSGGDKKPVRGKRGNAWKLYDMHGNVCEWCADYKGEYGEGLQVDPTGASSGSLRVYRGGSSCVDARLCRSVYRHCFSGGGSHSFLGFRPVRILPNQP